MDIETLLKAIDDEANETLLNLTTNKIKELNMKILKELGLAKNETKDMLNKLQNYKYIDELNELKYGTYIRWINLNDPNRIELTRGSFFCDVKITDNGILLVCKNTGTNTKHFQIKMDECLVFQRLNNQELILLSALDHLDK